MIQKKIFLLLITLLLATGASAQRTWEEYFKKDTENADSLRSERGMTNLKNVIVPRGQWLFGTTFSYSLHENNNYSLALVEGIESEGHTLDFSPVVAYSRWDNMSIGVRASYSRTFLAIDSAAITIGDEESSTSLTVDKYYSLKHIYSGSLIWRYYIPLGRSKRFALFNEAQLTFSGGQSKFARDQPIVGTYQQHFGLSLGMSPGIVAFATNNLAIEINIGLLGVGYDKTTQVHNQVEVGEINSSSMSFKVNLFSVSLGLAAYL